MRTALTALCGFTILASCWLLTMYLVLRHPGFEWRATLALGYAAIGIVTLVAARAAAPPAALSATVAVCAVLLAGVGGWAIHTNVDDGFVDVIGLAFITQGLLALVFVARRLAWPASTRTPS